MKLRLLFQLSREGLWVLSGQGMAVLGSLVGIRFLTELLGPENYGELALGLTIATLMNQALLGPLSQGATRFYAPAAEANEIKGYLKAIRHLTFLETGAIGLLLLFAVIGIVLAQRPEDILAIVALFLFSLFNGYTTILSGIQNAARQRIVVAAHQAFASWGRFSIAVVFLLAFRATSTEAMFGYAVASILTASSQIFFFRKIIIRKIRETDTEINWRSNIWSYAWPFSLWGIFTWAQMASDRWSLEFLSTTADVGLYAVLFQLGYYPITMLTDMIVQLLGPVLYQYAGDATDDERIKRTSHITWKLTIWSLVATIAVFVIFMFTHEIVFQIFVAREYFSVSYLLPWVVLGGGIFAAGQTVALNMMSQMRTRALIRVKISTALIGIGLNFLGAWQLGLPGIIIAGIVTSLFYFLYVTIVALTSKRAAAAI